MVVLPSQVVEQRFVVTGLRSDGEIVIQSGLAADERIIIEGIHRVRHGQTVEALSQQEYEQIKQEEKQAELEAAQSQGEAS